VKIRSLAVCLLIATSTSAFAEGWEGKGQAGLLLSQGNTEAKSANAALDLSRSGGGWKHAFSAATLYGQSGEITSAQRWNAGWQSDREITPRLFGFGALRYGRDKFSGFQYQATASAGLGYKFIDSEPVKLTGQVGAGYRKFRPELITKDAAGAVIARTPLASVGEMVMTAGLDYEHALTATTSITNRFLAEYGSSNTLLTDNFALAVKMSDKLALSFGISVQHNSDPPAGLESRDTVETVNLVYAF
jgi:putative salt-induced outer membrane protein